MMLPIAAAVILYNPDAIIIQNIESYSNQVDLIIAIDNSDCINHDLINVLVKNPKIQYINNNGNQGIAHALNTGAAKAIAKGYQWLLTMDQDSSFSGDMILAFLACFQKYELKENVAVFSPLHDTAKAPHTVDDQCHISENLIVMTSGNLLNLTVFQNIGGFEEKLFIDEVDHDYCLKAHQFDYKVICFSNILLNHELGKLKIICHNGKMESYRSHTPKRFYYITRNNLYVWYKYRHSFPNFIHQRSRNVAKSIIFALVYDDQRVSRLMNIFKGIFHFIVGRYGK